MAKSKFEKLMEKTGLFLPEEPENGMEGITVPSASGESYAAQNYTMQAQGEVVTDGSGNVIANAYSTLPKSDDNIYIVEELLNNFAMLPDASKPEVVRSTLATMQKDVGKFIMEANTKKTALANALARYSQNVADDVAKLDLVIKESEATINKCRQEQLDKKNSLEQQKKAVAEEAKRLEKIIEILGGK